MSTVTSPSVSAHITPFYVTGGTLPSDASSYIVRQADRDLLDSLLAGDFCYVLNTRQMGKSSLMIRTAARLREGDVAVAVLDLTAIGQNLTPEQWYDGLLVSLGEQLRLEDALDDFWSEQRHLGPMQRFLAAIGQVALPAIGKRKLVVFVDEIDAVRSLPFSADELFAGIRECYNRRRQDPVWDRLVFCLLGVATPADLITDTRMSPFNIGRRILISDFTDEDAEPLAPGLGLGGGALLTRALYWTGGHPYMTQRLCRAIAEAQPSVTTPDQVDGLCQRLFLTKQARDSDDNLAFVRNRLLRSEVDLGGLLALYTQVRNGKRVKDDETNPMTSVLRLSGVVKVDHAGYLRVRNRVYDRVFDRDWVVAHMPDAELRRQKSAYRRGMLRAAAIFGSFAVALAFLATLSVRYANRAESATKAAGKNLGEAKRARDQSQHLASQLESLLGQQRSTIGLLKKTNDRLETALNDANEQRQRADLSATAANRALAAAKRSAAFAERETLRARQAEARTSRSAFAAQTAAQLAHDAARRADTERGHAEEAKSRAEAAGRRLRLTGYISDMNRAYRAYVDGYSDIARSLLANYFPPTVAERRDDNSAKSDDLRGVEWRYLWDKTKSSGGNWLAVSGDILNLALSPDNTRIAVLADTGQLTILNAETYVPISVIQRFQSFPVQVTGKQRLLAFTGDGSEVVCATNAAPRIVTIYNLLARKSRTLNLPFAADACVLTRDGNHVTVVGRVAGTGNSFLGTFDIGDGHSVVQVPMNERVRGACLLRDGSLITSSSARTAQWDVLSGTLIGSWPVANAFSQVPPKIIALDDDTHQSGSRIVSHPLLVTALRSVTSGVPADIVGLDVSTGRLAFRLTGHTSAVSGLALSANGRWLATGGSDRTARIWDMQNLKLRAVGRHSLKGITDIVISDDGKTAVTGGPEGARFWTVSEDDAEDVGGQTNALTEISPDGTRECRISNTGVITIAPIGSDEPLVKMPLSLPPDESLFFPTLAFTPDGRSVLVPEKGGPIRRFDAQTGMETSDSPWVGHEATVISLVTSNDGMRAASCDGRGHLFIRELDSGRILRRELLQGTYAGNEGYHARPLALSPHGDVIAYVAGDDKLEVSDIKSWKTLLSFFGSSKSDVNRIFTHVVFSPDGKYLATSNAGGSVAIYETTNWQRKVSIEPNDVITSLVFSPDSRTLITSSYEGRLGFLNVETGKELFGLVQQNAIRQLIFDKSGTNLLSAPLRSGSIHRYSMPMPNVGDSEVPVNPDYNPVELVLQSVPSMKDVRNHRVPGQSARIVELPNLMREDGGDERLKLFLKAGSNADAVLTDGQRNEQTIDISEIGNYVTDVQMRKPLTSLLSKHRYVLQFRGISSQNRDSDYVDIHYTDRGKTWREFRRPLLLGTDWRTFRFTFVFVGPVTTENELLYFTLGAQTGRVTFADMILVQDPTDGQAPPRTVSP